MIRKRTTRPERQNRQVKKKNKNNKEIIIIYFDNINKLTYNKPEVYLHNEYKEQAQKMVSQLPYKRFGISDVLVEHIDNIDIFSFICRNLCTC